MNLQAVWNRMLRSVSGTPRKRHARCSIRSAQALEDRRLLFANNSVLSEIFAPVRAPVHENITEEGLRFLKPEVIGWLQDANVGTDLGIFDPLNDALHFDNSNFTGGAAVIRAQYQEALEVADPEDFDSDELASDFGRLLHTVQDFYAHSNWVNQGMTQLVDNTLDEWSEMTGYTVLPSGAMLLQGAVPAGMTLTTSPTNPFQFLINGTIRGIVTGGFGSSGNQAPAAARVSHDDLNHDHNGDADTPARPLFAEAYALAVQQTTHEFARLGALIEAEYGHEGICKLLEEWVSPDEESQATARELLGIESQPIDLVFVIDTTGSMADDIDAVKASATDIIHKLEDDSPCFRIGIVTYRDAGDEYVTHTQLSFTSDSDAAIAAIQSITVDGGGDWPEAVYAALDHAILNLDGLGEWRGGAVPKEIILMGDAPPHDPDVATGATGASVAKHALEAGGVIVSGRAAAAAADVTAPLSHPVDINPIVIGNDSSAIAAFQAIAENNRGKLFTASTADDIVNAILDAIDDIGGGATPPTELDLVDVSDTGRRSDDNFTGDTTPTFRVHADPGSEVKFFVDGVEVGTATELLDEPGVFEITLAEGDLKLGDNSITATADDSEPSEGLIVSLGETRQVILSRRKLEYKFTQEDSTDVVIRVNNYATATVGLLANPERVELVSLYAGEIRPGYGNLTVSGTGGLADIALFRITTNSFGTVGFNNVALDQFVARRNVDAVSIRGNDSTILGTFDVRGNLGSLLARTTELEGSIYVRGDVGKLELGTTSDESRIQIRGHVERLSLFESSTINMSARSAGTLIAMAGIEGVIQVKTRVGLLDLRGDSDLTVTVPRIKQIRNAGTMDGEYHVALINQLTSRGTILATFDSKTRISRRR